MSETGKENKSSVLGVNIEIKDLLGVSAPAKELVRAITKGIGVWSAPFQRRIAAKQDIKIFEDWAVAYEKAGMEIKQGEVSLDQRAATRLKIESRKHQENRESVAALAIEEFRKLDDTSDAIECKIEYEWIDRFWRIAENVHSQDFQSLWGRVLARKAANPSGISARTLEFLSLLSYEEAKMLEGIASIICRVERPDGSKDIGIIDLLPHSPNPMSPNADEIESQQVEMSSIVQNLDVRRLGPLGLCRESGWAHELRQGIIDQAMLFSIGPAKLRLEDNAADDGQFIKCIIFAPDYEEAAATANRPKYQSLGSGYGVSELGSEIFDLIECKENSEYIKSLKRGFEAQGFKLHQVK